MIAQHLSIHHHCFINLIILFFFLIFVYQLFIVVVFILIYEKRSVLIQSVNIIYEKREKCSHSDLWTSFWCSKVSTNQFSFCNDRMVLIVCGNLSRIWLQSTKLSDSQSKFSKIWNRHSPAHSRSSSQPFIDCFSNSIIDISICQMWFCWLPSRHLSHLL